MRAKCMLWLNGAPYFGSQFGPGALEARAHMLGRNGASMKTMQAQRLALMPCMRVADAMQLAALLAPGSALQEAPLPSIYHHQAGSCSAAKSCPP
eukprot:1134459-Pelagomonas_calceolata.AAC.4